MVTRKTLFILIALGAILFAAVCVGAFFFYQKITLPAPIGGGENRYGASKIYQRRRRLFFIRQRGR